MMPAVGGSVERLWAPRNTVGESPVWLAAEQALYWVDIPERRLWRWSAADGCVNHWLLPEQAGCIAPAEGGGWICGMESGVARLALTAAGTPVVADWLARLHHPRPGMRFNDGRCDRQGRWRAGTMVMDMAAALAVGSLYALSSPPALVPLVGKLIVPNGLAFSPEGTTMYLSDSHPRARKIWAFDYDPDHGLPRNRRLFVDMNHHPGRPDGAAVDVDGCYWTCANDAGMLLRFTPAGVLDRACALPVSKPAMCAFGGAGLDTLFVVSIRSPQDGEAAGGLLAWRPGVCGLEEPACRL